VSSLTANGIEHHVQELGEGGVPVVMLHGLVLGSLASWYFSAGPSLAKTRLVRMYDLRGHGRSQRAASGYDTTTLASDLVELTTDLPPFDLVGHSWGALVAIRFAIEHPDYVRKLVVVEAPLPPSSAIELGSFLTTKPERIVEALPEALRAAVATGGRQAKRLVENVVHLVRDTTLLADLSSEPEPRLKDLDTPTLALYGDRSSCLTAGEQLQRSAPYVELKILHGGHYLHLDARAELTAAITEFLDG
jgi:pimeloyl-ACP methyl ester carboxylesterase